MTTKRGNQSFLCPLWPEFPNRCDTILGIKLTFSILSLIACIVVIALIWLFRNYKSCVQRLILYLTISAGIESFSFMIGSFHTKGSACQFQSFVIQYFSWSTILWVSAIGVHIILVIRSISVSNIEKWFHIICWSVPFIFACIPFIGHKYGTAGLWCWIKRSETATRFGTWFVPKFLIITLLIVAYVYIIATVMRLKHRWSGMYNAEEERDKVMLVNEVKPLVAFPFIYVLLSIPSLIYRIDDAVHPQHLPSYPLGVITVICSPSVGALNAIAFALYSEIQKQLSWKEIKFHFLSHFSTGAVVREVNFDDTEDGSLTKIRE